jgi:choice-of-anchor B domain-containing protein
VNHIAYAVLAGLTVVTAAWAHQDDPKLLDRFGPVKGPGWQRSSHTPMASGGFDSAGDIELQAWLTLDDLGGADTGNDCWGYVSPSGREYAIIGDSDGTSFVDITDPTAPIIEAKISGPGSLWRDVKVHNAYAYIVSEGGDGIQVVDMSNIDIGVVTHVNTVTTGGTSATHNIVIDTDSGFLYRTGGSDNGLRIYDLNSSPTNPPYVGSWSNKYVHDAQVVTYPQGSPYEGRQVAFCYAGFNGGWSEPGLTILDVTNKSAIFTIGEMQHSNNNYSHQGWITEDLQHIYLNDELDEQNTGTPTTTRIINVSDLANPTQVGTCTTGSSSVDHNLYIKGNLMFQANYRSGLRIFDITNRTAPVQVAWYDTYPGSDSAQFNGIWSNYPFFASGTVIGSDLERGLFVWTLSEPSVVATIIDPLPDMLDPSGGDSFRVSATLAQNMTLDTDATELRWNDGSGWNSASMSIEDAGTPIILRATFGTTECGSMVEFDAKVATTDGFTVTVASGQLLSANEIIDSFSDDCESDPGWTVDNDCTDGQWGRSVPAGDGLRGDPPADADGSGACWLTDNGAGNTDVDGGTTTLISPILDASNSNAILEYSRWYSNDFGAAPNEDIFYVRISDDGGASWTLLEQVGPSGSESNGGWYDVQFDLASIGGITPNAQFRIAFEANDLGDGSVIEAGIDAIRISSIDCEDCVGDIDGNGTVDVEDVLAAIAGFGSIYDVNDLLEILGAFGSDC